jgi:nucleotide-binding universal stress UspA family protein
MGSDSHWTGITGNPYSAALRYGGRDEFGYRGAAVHDRSEFVRHSPGGRHMTKRILVPIDGSPLSQRALRHALEEFPDASITVLHVVDLFEPGYGAYPDFETTYEPLMGSEEWYDRAEEVSERLFEDARELAAEYDREVSTTSEIGDPKRIIVDFAAEEDIDHIVLGAHGRTEEERPVFGSIAEIVARRATVPVTLIR